MKLQNYKTMTLTFLTFSSLLPVDNVPDNNHENVFPIHKSNNQDDHSLKLNSFNNDFSFWLLFVLIFRK